MTATFQYVDGVCGSGKTYTAIGKMAFLVKSGSSAIYVTNTKALLKQTETQLEALKVATVLTIADCPADPNYQSIIQKITSTLSESRTYPCVFLCTTESLIRSASQLEQHAKLPLYIDEGFRISDAGEINCNTEQEAQGIAFKIRQSDIKPSGYVDHNDYKLPVDQTKLLQYLSNPLTTVQVTVAKSKFQWISSLDVRAFSSKFSSVTLLAACHEDTLQYHAIKSSGCSQVKLDWGLKTSHYTSGSVEVLWVLEDAEWRTTKVKANRGKSEEGYDEIERLVIHFEWRCLQADKDLGDAVVVTPEFTNVKQVAGMGEHLPVQAHGMNNYTHLHNHIDLHTQMPMPFLSNFYKDQYGMSEEEIRRSCYHYDRYQAALRVSLRISDDKSHVFCFGDKPTAQYFVSKLDPRVNVSTDMLWNKLSWDTSGRATYSNRVSENTTEQKNRSADRKRLRKANPSLATEVEDRLLNYFRDQRRTWIANGISSNITIKIIREQIRTELEETP